MLCCALFAAAAAAVSRLLHTNYTCVARLRHTVSSFGSLAGYLSVLIVAKHTYNRHVGQSQPSLLIVAIVACQRVEK